VGIIHRNLTMEEQVRQVQWVRGQIHFGTCYVVVS
jgi:hypothetical protein